MANKLLIVLCGLMVWFSHLDRVTFLKELNATRTDYINTLNNMSSDIKIIRNDVVIIKELVEKQDGGGR